MTKRQINSPLRQWVMILNSVCHKGFASNGPKCSAAEEES